MLAQQRHFCQPFLWLFSGPFPFLSGFKKHRQQNWKQHAGLGSHKCHIRMASAPTHPPPPSTPPHHSCLRVAPARIPLHLIPLFSIARSLFPLQRFNVQWSGGWQKEVGGSKRSPSSSRAPGTAGRVQALPGTSGASCHTGQTPAGCICAVTFATESLISLQNEIRFVWQDLFP